MQYICKAPSQSDAKASMQDDPKKDETQILCMRKKDEQSPIDLNAKKRRKKEEN